MTVRRTAVALLSGGLDSGTALALWLDAGHAVDVALVCDYGQRSSVQEVRAGSRLAARLGVPIEVVALPWLGQTAGRAGSTLVAGASALPERTREAPGDTESAAAVWVPARNVVLLALAAARAEAVGAEAVLVGFNREEAATFADNSTDFVAAMNVTLALGTRSAVRVEAPTLAMDKPEIVAAARALGLTRDDFWSCYADATAPCGVCESCVRSDRAWDARPIP